jgi:hypothetical protein
LSKRDLFVAACIAVALFLFSGYLSAQIPEVVLGNYDVWFGADLPRVVGDMTSPSSAHGRSNIHPLFSLIAVPLTKSLLWAGYSGLAACLVLVGASAGLAGAFLYLACRGIGLALIDALLAVLVFASSAAFMFSWSVPETYPFGAMTIALALYVATSGCFSLPLWILASASTLAITTTNWVSALMTTLVFRRFPDFIKISVGALVLVAAGAILQKCWMPETTLFFLPGAMGSERTFLKSPTVERAINFFIFTGVSSMPVTHSLQPPTVLISSGPAATLLDPARAVACVAWIFLGGLGALNAFSKAHRRLGIAVLGILSFEFILHQVYGDEPFLYSAHFIPAFTMLIAFGLAGRASRLARVAAIVFILAGTTANLRTFLATCGLLG